MGKKHIKIVLVLAMLLAAVFAYPIYAAEPAEMPEYIFRTTDDTEVSTNGRGYKATVLIFGQTICSNTGYTISDVAKSDWEKDPQIQVIFAEISNKPKAEVQEFVKNNKAENLITCYDDQKGHISMAMWSAIRQHKGDDISSVRLPVVVLIDGNNRIQNIAMDGLISADELIGMVNQFADTGYTPSKPSEPSDPYDGKLAELTISGTEDYQSAKEVCRLVNEARAEKGLSPLYFDKALTEAAMQRAAEIAVYYSHTRPDGTSCFDIFPNRRTAMGENIAIGHLSAAHVTEGWLDSPGHYANIMNEGAINLGVGSFVDSDGRRYWVQCFDGSLEHEDPEIANREVTRTIQAKSGLVSLIEEKQKKIFYLCSTDSAGIQMSVRNQNMGYGFGRAVLDASSFTYESSNPAIASVDASGMITLHEEGEASITATLKGDAPHSVIWNIESRGHETEETVVPASMQQAGSVASKCSRCGYEEYAREIVRVQSISLTSSSYPYCGLAYYPEAEVFDANGKRLQKGEDYAVSYQSDCRNIGFHMVSIQLKGNYTGQKTESFCIVPGAAAGLKVKALKRGIQVSWKKNASVSGYEIRYSYKKNFSGAKKADVPSVFVSKKQIASLKSRKICYVSIRAYKRVYVNGRFQKLYGAWSSAKQVAVK